MLQILAWNPGIFQQWPSLSILKTKWFVTRGLIWNIYFRSLIFAMSVKSIYVCKIHTWPFGFVLKRMAFHSQIVSDFFRRLKGDSFPAFETDAKIGFLPEFQWQGKKVLQHFLFSFLTWRQKKMTLLLLEKAGCAVMCPWTALLKCMRRQTWDIFLPASGVQFGKGGNRQPRKINHFSA